MPDTAPCLDCARPAPLHARGRCVNCYQRYRLSAGFRRKTRRRCPQPPRCSACRGPVEAPGLCRGCLDAPPAPPMGARLREPLLGETIALYAARASAGLNIFTGGPRR